MNKTIIGYFEDTERLYPNKIAVTDRETQLTFNQLKNMAMNVASRLLEKGLENGPVAIYMESNVNLTAAMLGVLYTDNFYVVLDYESPNNRIEKILNTLKPAGVLCDNACNCLEKINQENITVIEFEKNIEPLDRYKSKKLEEIQGTMTLETPAYGLFTSGSTGDPKGVVVTHGNVISYINWFTKCFEINENSSFGAQTPLYFSMSVSDFYGSMFTGGCYNLIPKEYFAFPAKLVDYLNEKAVNTIYWVPSAMGIVSKWDLFKYKEPMYIDKVMFAGEAMPVKYLNYWRRYLPKVQFANLFGPTETTDICTYYKVQREFKESETLPIGQPCENCQAIVVEDGRPVEKGKLGELYIKGPFVAKGYYRNPEKTRQAFVQNPLHDDYPDIVYKTGDLVYENQFGELEYAGRRDYQIKHMGYRIELGEIESVINSIDQSLMSVCIYDDENDKLILVYEASSEMDDDLNSFAADKLPVYMRPEKYEKVDCLPINQNGKIDRKAIRKMIIKG